MARHGGGAFAARTRPRSTARPPTPPAGWPRTWWPPAPPAAARCRWPTPSAWPSRCRSWSRRSAPRPSTPSSIEQAVREVFDLRPAAIIRDLDLRRPIYRKTAAYGHFGRAEPGFTWEQLGKLDELQGGRRRLSRPRAHRAADRRGSCPTSRGLDKRSTTWSRTRCGTRCASGTMVRVAAARPAGRRLGRGARSARRRRAGGTLRPLAKVTGWGRRAELIDLAAWAAWRWAGRLRSFLRGGVAAAGGAGAAGAGAIGGAGPGRSIAGAARLLAARGRGRCACRRRRPAPDRAGRGAVGPTLVVDPSVDQARLLGARLRRAGAARGPAPAGLGRRPRAGRLVVGARAAAWAPVPRPRPRWWCSTSTTRRCRRSGRRPGTPATWPSSGPGGPACPACWCRRAVARTRSAGAGDLLDAEPQRGAGGLAGRRGRRPAATTSRGAVAAVSAALVRHLRDAGRRVVCVLNPRAGPACWPAGRAGRWPAASAARPPWPSRRRPAALRSLRDRSGRSCARRAVVARFVAAAGGDARCARSWRRCGRAPGGRGHRGRRAARRWPTAAVYVGTEAVLHQVPRGRRRGLPRLRPGAAGPALPGRRAGHGAAGPGRPAGRGRARRRAAAGPDPPAPPRGARRRAPRRSRPVWPAGAGPAAELGGSRPPGPGRGVGGRRRGAVGALRTARPWRSPARPTAAGSSAPPTADARPTPWPPRPAPPRRVRVEVDPPRV